jgi:alpha-amylase
MLTRQGLTGGADPMNREAIWLHGYTTTKPLYQMFKRLNHARRRALTFSPFLSTHLKWHKYDTHTVVLSKPPLVSVLTNFGSSAPPRVYYLPSASTTYAPHMPVIDVLTGQVFATDPTGGLAVTIMSGEPRVFLPLGIWEGRKQGIWQNVQLESHNRPHIAGPSRKKSSASLTHSRGSSKSSVFSWLGWGK